MVSRILVIALVLWIVADARVASADDAGTWDLALAAGVTDASVLTDTETGGVEPGGLLSLRVALTDRLDALVLSPALVYRGGTRGELEWIPWGGVVGWSVGYSSISGAMYSVGVGAGLDIRRWLGPRTVLNLGISAQSRLGRFFDASDCSAEFCSVDPTRHSADTWRARVSGGLSHAVGDRITLNAGVAITQNVLHDGSRPDGDRMSLERDLALSFGSIQRSGLRALPLIQIRINPRWSVDGYAGASYRAATEEISESYMLGFTKTW